MKFTRSFRFAVILVFFFCFAYCDGYSINLYDEGGNFTDKVALDWKTFYRDNLGIDVDFGGVFIPSPSVDYFDIFIQKGIDENIIISACKKRFRTWSWSNDITSQISFGERSNKERSYFVRFKKVVEADEECKNLSAYDLVGKNINGITLLERIVLELYYFSKTGSHLDIGCVTLCSGSRYLDGRVPRVDWGPSGGELRIFWYRPDYALPSLRTRSVVSY